MSNNEPTRSASEEQAIAKLEQRNDELEIEKLKLERVKTWLTVVAIVLPIIASLITFYFTNKYTKENFIRQIEERDISSRIELIKLLVEKPERKDEIIQIWKAVFPADEWPDNLKPISLTQPNKSQ